MTGNEAILKVIGALESLGVPYMVVGSYSTNLYGIPRSTEDADVVIELGSISGSAIANRLGSGLRMDPQMSFETSSMTPRHVIEVTGTEFKVELFHLGEDEYDRVRFGRRRHADFFDGTAWVATVEDAIVTKLRWGRSKDRDDVQDVIAVQNKFIDWDYVHSWCNRHDTRALLDAIRRTIPPM